MEINALFKKLFDLERENALSPFDLNLARVVSLKSVSSICKAVQCTNKVAKHSSSLKEKNQWYYWKIFFLNSLILKQATKGKIIWGRKNGQGVQSDYLAVSWDTEIQKLSFFYQDKGETLLQVHLPLKNLWPDSARRISGCIGQDVESLVVVEKLTVLSEKWGAALTK